MTEIRFGGRCEKHLCPKPCTKCAEAGDSSTITVPRALLVKANEAIASGRNTNETLDEIRAALTAANAVSAHIPAVGEMVQPQAPYANCRFRICDLPGQCKGEGKCHHPAVAQAQGHLPEKRDIGEFDPKKSDSTYFRGLGWNECIDAMSVIHPQATEPAGYKLVPVEPTQEMLDAVVTTLDDHLLGPDAEKQYREDWAAMLAAAPEAKQ